MGPISQDDAELLARAEAKAGGLVRLAEELRLGKSAVSGWKKRGPSRAGRIQLRYYVGDAGPKPVDAPPGEPIAERVRRREIELYLRHECTDIWGPLGRLPDQEALLRQLRDNIRAWANLVRARAKIKRRGR